MPETHFDSELPVLVVGAGPTGLFAACELARYGIRPRVVERWPIPHRQARATAIQPASLELLARAGVLEPFLERSVRIRRTRFFGPGMTDIGVSSFNGIGCAHEYQCSLPQWQTEAILLEHLHRLGGEVERGVTVLSVDDKPNGLHVALSRPDKTVESTLVRYLLGAGGAHSVTRHSMHEPLAGQTYAGHYIVADLRVELAHEPETSRLFACAEGFVLLAPLPEERWISFVNLDEATASAAAADPPDTERVSALLNRRIGVDVGVHDVRWVAQFLMQNRMARHIGDARRFLLGDAAHLSSPIAGEGLNSGLMDAADIAWKLALVLRGAALPALLDSYALERSMADHHVLDVSDRLHRRVMDLESALTGAGLPSSGPADPALALEQARARAMLDVSYAGSPLIGEHLGPGLTDLGRPYPGQRFPERIRLAGVSHHLLTFGDVVALDRFRLRWRGLVAVEDGAAMGLDSARAGVPEGGAVLVRPDGFIGFRVAPADAAGIEVLDAHLASYLVVPDTDRGASI